MATSKLQQQVSALLNIHLGQYTIRENYRPDWLDRLELDFYIKELQVGIEVQGRQHFEFLPKFHKDIAGFQAQQDRDLRKADLCTQLRISLYYIRYPSRLMDLLECLNRVSCVYQDSMPQHPSASHRTRATKGHKQFWRAYGKAAYAYKINDSTKLQNALARIEQIIERDQLYVLDRHLRQLLLWRFGSIVR